MKKVLFCIMVLFVACQSSQNSQQDKQACVYAQKEENLETWEEYLESFPNGECSFEARSKIRKLKKQVSEEVAKREQYLKEHKIGNLVWSNRASEAMNRSSAKYYCENLTEGGFTNWRLPNIDELRTLIRNCPKTETGGSCKVSEKKTCLSNNCLQPDGSCYCENRDGDYYSKLGDEFCCWSSSIELEFPDNSWVVCFGDGSVNNDGLDSLNLCVRCVRNY